MTAEIRRCECRFIDWVMRLPEQLNERVLEEAHELEEGKKMPYVTSFERIGMRKGLEQEREEQRALVLRLLTHRVGELSATLQNKLARLSHEQIEALGLALLDFKSKADLTVWLKAQTPKPRRTRKPQRAVTTSGIDQNEREND